MGFGFTLSNAMSGLTAAARSIELISANVANASTPGYGRREIMLSALSLNGAGAGVRVDGVARIVDQTAIADRRLADAALGAASTRGEFLTRLETAIGLPGEAGSLSGRLAAFEAAAASAASRPDETSRLASIRDAAVGLARQFNLISTEIRSLRMSADGEIARQVSEVNSSLARVADLNGEIRMRRGLGQDASALIDERQRLIDRVSGIIPIRELPRENGQVALFTPTGAALVDGAAATLGFSPAGMIDPAMTLAGGALSGLTLNGRPVATAGTAAPFAGGALAENFRIRDELAVDANAQLDALARDLVERFADPTLDPTLAAGAPGLFTDAGAAFAAANETGLAARLSFNGAADPAQGGTLRLLRDGLGAATPGPAGDATLLNGYLDALTAQRVPATGGFAGGGSGDLAAEFLSGIATARLSAETERSFASTRQQTFATAELQAGVDTDQEMQKLLLVEQAYAANARVLQTVDEMIGTLLEI